MMAQLLDKSMSGNGLLSQSEQLPEIRDEWATSRTSLYSAIAEHRFHFVQLISFYRRLASVCRCIYIRPA
jgi:hypothetical protein